MQAGRQAGSIVSNTVVTGSNSSNTAVAAVSNSSIDAVASNCRFISINFYPFPYSAALV